MIDLDNYTPLNRLIPFKFKKSEKMDHLTYKPDRVAHFNCYCTDVLHLSQYVVVFTYSNN